MFIEIFVEGYPPHNTPILVDVSKATKYTRIFKEHGKKYTLGKFVENNN